MSESELVLTNFSSVDQLRSLFVSGIFERFCKRAKVKMRKYGYHKLDKWANGEIEKLMSTGPEKITKEVLQEGAKNYARGNNFEVNSYDYWWKTFV